MANWKEIKVTPEEFDIAISSLTEYKDSLCLSRDTLVQVDTDMKKDWLGDGGTAFMLSAKVLEEEYKERISDLESEINDLKVTKSSLFGLDYYLGRAIDGAIEGAKENATNIKNNYDDLVNTVNSIAKKQSYIDADFVLSVKTREEIKHEMQ